MSLHDLMTIGTEFKDWINYEAEMRFRKPELADLKDEIYCKVEGRLPVGMSESGELVERLKNYYPIVLGVDRNIHSSE